MRTLALVLEAALRATGVAAAVALILLVGRVRSSVVRHASWTAVVCVMLLMPVLPSVVPAIPVPVPVQIAVPFALVDSADSGPAPRDVLITPGGLTEVQSVPSSSGIGTAVFASVPQASRWPFLVLGVYGLGVCVLLSRLLLGWMGMARIRRTAVPVGEPAVAGAYESGRVATPLIAGVLAPRIVLPTTWRTWPDEKLLAILAHERAHIRRRDPLVAVLAHVNRCVFWFHPLAWWLERRLAVTAEDACDEAAVRAIGHPRRYAEVLLDIAEAVRRRGSRVSWQGIGVDGNGLLGRRIDRILRGDLLRTMSRTRTIAIAIGCAAAIWVGVACRQSVTAAPLKEDPEVAARLAQQKASRDFYDAATTMTAPQVDELEASLKKNPDDLVSLKKLVTFYRWSGQKVFGWNEMIARRRPHILWLVEHHPESDLLLGQMSEKYDPAGYAQAKRSWLAHLAKPDVTTTVVSNAAAFFQESDKAFTETLLLRLEAMDPGGPQPRVRGNVYYSSWTSRLGTLYALVLVGSDDFTLFNVVKSTNVVQVHSPYALEVRKKLADSKNALLIASAGSYLVDNATNAKTDFDHVALGKTYLERALALDPQQTVARQALARLEERQQPRPSGLSPLRAKQAELIGGEIGRKALAGQRLTNEEGEALRQFEYEAASSFPEDARFGLLPELADSAYMWAEHLDYTKHDSVGAKAAWERSKKAARDVLTLAPKFRDRPDYGIAVFRATLALGTHALREGDRATAVRYLLEASRVPIGNASKRPYPSSLEGRLTNYLLKAGERATVVEYLERVAESRTFDRDRLLKDAAAIRAGRMPMSYQYMVTPH